MLIETCLWPRQALPPPSPLESGSPSGLRRLGGGGSSSGPRGVSPASPPESPPSPPSPGGPHGAWRRGSPGGRKGLPSPDPWPPLAGGAPLGGCGTKSVLLSLAPGQAGIQAWEADTSSTFSSSPVPYLELLESLLRSWWCLGSQMSPHRYNHGIAFLTPCSQVHIIR